MWRSLLVGLGLMGLFQACGDADGGGGAAGDTAAEGAYVGDVAVQTDVAGSSIFATAEIEVAGDGSVSGKITTKAPSATVGEVGSVSGTLSLADVASYQADLVLELPTLGTFTAAGSLAYGEASGQLAGQLSARDDQGALVGSTIISVHQE